MTDLSAALARGLEPRLEFECFVATLTGALTAASAIAVDDCIKNGLECLAEHLQAERSSIARFANDGGLLTVTHSSGASAIPLSPRGGLRWYRERLGRGRRLVLSQLPDDLPAGARAEREAFHWLGARSHLAVPLVRAGRTWGVIAVSDLGRYRRWTRREIRRVRLTGEIMLAALLRHEAEATARRRGDELIHVARLATLSDLTVTLTHELNQPLTAIRANAQATQRLLARGAQGDLDGVLSDIVADATRSADLIQRLGALLRRRHLERSPVDLNQSVRDIHAIARMVAERHGANLVLRLGPDLPIVTGDCVQLQQVLLNLIRNAAEAMAKIEPDSRRVVVETTPTAPNEITVSVIDAGPSIGDQALDRMFAPFYTTKPDGLGMGLAISRAIVEAHGGRLWVERRPEGGLVMRFALPAAAKAAAPARNRTKVPLQASRSRGKLGLLEIRSRGRI
jgi:signal transduction histidine kinase